MNQQAISVLFLTKYTCNGASSRYRSFQYLPYLEQNDIHCQVSPLSNCNKVSWYINFVTYCNL
jgi:hypothetical protein